MSIRPRRSRGSAALAAAIFALAAPSLAGGSAARGEVTPIVEHLLDGTKLVVVAQPGAERAALRVVVRAGGDDDPPGRAGLAELSAHAVLQGTYDMQHGALFRVVDKAGGALSVEVRPELTVFGADVAQGGVREVLVPLLKTITAPALPFVDLERVRVVAGATDVEAQPLTHAGWAARHLAFPSGHGGLVLTGSAETRRAVTREEVTSFYQEHYLPGRTVVIVVADLDIDEARRLVELGLHGAPVPAAPLSADRRTPNVPSEAHGKAKRTLAVSAALLDTVPAAACFTAAQLLEQRLHRRVGAHAPCETHAGCERAFGATLLTLAARSSSPSSSVLPDLVREVRRSGRVRPPTAAERAQVAALLAERHASALATAAGIATILVAAAGDEAPLAQAAARALRPPRLDWSGAAGVLKKCADDQRAIEVAFSPFVE